LRWAKPTEVAHCWGGRAEAMEAVVHDEAMPALVAACRAVAATPAAGAGGTSASRWSPVLHATARLADAARQYRAAAGTLYCGPRARACHLLVLRSCAPAYSAAEAVVDAAIDAVVQTPWPEDVLAALATLLRDNVAALVHTAVPADADAEATVDTAEDAETLGAVAAGLLQDLAAARLLPLLVWAVDAALNAAVQAGVRALAGEAAFDTPQLRDCEATLTAVLAPWLAHWAAAAPTAAGPPMDLPVRIARAFGRLRYATPRPNGTPGGRTVSAALSLCSVCPWQH
jgi:hypothetical protein